MVLVDRKGGFVWFYFAGLFSVFGGSDACYPEMFVGGEFRGNFVKLASGVFVLEKWLCYFSLGSFDTYLKEKGDDGVIKKLDICRL